MAEPRILWLSDALVLGLVMVVVVAALAALAIVVLAMGAAGGWWRPQKEASPAIARLAEPMPRRPPDAPRTKPKSFVRGVEIDVPTPHVDAFIEALRAAGWRAHETGEVVATEDSEEGLTTVAVDIPGGDARGGSGEEVR